MKSVKRKLVSLLPAKIRGYVMRKHLQLPEDADPAIEYKVATTSDLRWQAFNLTYQCYQETGSETQMDHPFRVNPYLTLPTTQTIVALRNNEVIGTLSLIRDSALGMPALEVLSRKEFSNEDEVIAEFSSLAISRRERGHRGRIFWGMIRYVWEINQRALKLNTIIAMVRPFRADLFINFMGFKKVQRKVIKNYAFSNGASVYCLKLNLDEFPHWVYRHYSRKRASGDLYEYLFCSNQQYLGQIDNEYLYQGTQNFTEEEVAYLHSIWEGKMAHLPPSQKALLASHYPNLFRDSVTQLIRKHPRIEVIHDAIIYENDSIHRVRVLNFASSGLLIQSEAKLRIGQTLHLKVRVTEFDSSRLIAKIVRKDEPKKLYGLNITEDDQAWKDYIVHVLGEKKVA